MANRRKKRCTNPACRKVFSYGVGEILCCPWCGKGSDRSWIGFRFGVDAVPVLRKGSYIVRLERLVTNRRVKAIKAYREVFRTGGVSQGLPSLKESKEIIDGLAHGRPYTLADVSAEALPVLMAEGHMDLAFRRMSSRASHAKRREGKGRAV